MSTELSGRRQIGIAVQAATSVENFLGDTSDGTSEEFDRYLTPEIRYYLTIENIQDRYYYLNKGARFKTVRGSFNTENVSAVDEDYYFVKPFLRKTLYAIDVLQKGVLQTERYGLEEEDLPIDIQGELFENKQNTVKALWPLFRSVGREMLRGGIDIRVLDYEDIKENTVEEVNQISRKIFGSRVEEYDSLISYIRDYLGSEFDYKTKERIRALDFNQLATSDISKDEINETIMDKHLYDQEILPYFLSTLATNQKLGELVEREKELEDKVESLVGRRKGENGRSEIRFEKEGLPGESDKDYEARMQLIDKAFSNLESNRMEIVQELRDTFFAIYTRLILSHIDYCKNKDRVERKKRKLDI